MFFDIIIFQTYENFFDGIHHFLFTASDLAQSKFQMHTPKNLYKKYENEGSIFFLILVL